MILENELAGGRRPGKSALMWHRLRLESAAAGRPILCVRCHQPHATVPAGGKCGCGCYAFGVMTPAAHAQLALPPEGVTS